MSNRELLIYDSNESCPYLPLKTARLPLRQPLYPLSGRELDARLAQGDRRCGELLYRPHCPSCSSCEPIRLDVQRWAPRATQRRVFRRGERELRWELGPPQVDPQRVALYDRHRNQRGLAHREAPTTLDDYARFLVDTCCDTFEIRYLYRGRLIGVAITDRGQTALSAVYCYFDPEFARFSPGVYSILKQIELARLWKIRYLYLGFYIAESPHMSYKARYYPHQRLQDGQWKDYDEAG